MTWKTRPYDPTRYLRTEDDQVALLEAALEDGHPAIVADAIGHVARARGMSNVARNAGLGRESLYKALSANGNPEFATVLKVIEALGFRLTVKAVEKPRAARTRPGAPRKKAASHRKPAVARKGTNRARATEEINSLKGTVRRPARPVTVDAMNRAIRKRAARR
jgi:probable addiction module antidote protein